MNRRLLHKALPWLALLAVGGVAAWLRYGLVEQSSMAELCGGTGSPWWCAWRQWLVLGFLHDVYGVAALIAGVFAVFSRRVAVVWTAAALGLFALVLYCYQTGALVLLIASLRLLRVQADAPPAVHDRPRQREVQRQP